MILRLPHKLIAMMRSSINRRLALLIAAAFLPVVAISSVVAWQSYRETTRVATEAAVLARQAVLARADLAFSILRQTLDHLGHAPPSTTDQVACNLSLYGDLALYGKVLSNIELLDPSGKVLCRAGSSDIVSPSQLALAARRWWPSLQEKPGFMLDEVEIDGGGHPVLMGVRSVTRGGRVVGMVVGDLLIHSFTDIGVGDDIVSMWLVPNGMPPIPLRYPKNKEARSAEPPAALFADLARHDDATPIRRAKGGDFYAYASAALADGHRLVIGERANDIHYRAKATLARLMGGIAALSLIGLAAMIVGTNMGIARPIKRLHREVERWQREGKFDPEATRGAPRELCDLGQSFASATASLTERALQLRMATVQQDLLMQEIHHRVKNNLQIIASLLNLQASRIRLPEAQAEFQSARDRVRALATLHRHLYSHGELNTINMRSFLTELCEQLFAAMGKQPGQQIALEIEAPEMEMSSDQAVPLALIVTEAVSNALKYAFPPQHDGTISVRLTREDDQILLTIRDDGIGMAPAGTPDPERRRGIGIQLIRGFVKQLAATLEVVEEAGTTYRIAMPLQRSRDISHFVRNALARSGVPQA